MKLLSVIVPVYNSEEYLKRCIDSILNSTYKDMEILLIDDGSEDKSLEICNEYAKNNKRIKVFHQENKGQSAARNLALDNIKGDYVAFVDSDDWINPNIYEFAIKKIEETKADVIDFECKKVKQYENNSNESVEKYVIKEYKEDEILERYLYAGLTVKNCPFSLCRKIFVKQAFDKVRFPEGRINEDIIGVYRALMNCKLMLEIKYVGYYYFQNNKSTTRRELKTKDLDLLKACDEIIELSKDKGKNIKKYAKIKRARSDFSLLAKLAYYGAEEKIDVKSIAKKLTKNIRKNYFLLIFSPISINRKILITIFAVNYKIIEIPLKLRRKNGKRKT